MNKDNPSLLVFLFSLLSQRQPSFVSLLILYTITKTTIFCQSSYSLYQYKDNPSLLVFLFSIPLQRQPSFVSLLILYTVPLQRQPSFVSLLILYTITKTPSFVSLLILYTFTEKTLLCSSFFSSIAQPQQKFNLKYYSEPDFSFHTQCQRHCDA